MIFEGCVLVHERDIARYAWFALRQFQNVSLVEQQIRRLHVVPARQKDNVRKQATQIRYCLQQAKEYYDAGVAASLATSPNLFYYSLMSFALAEILLKQDGLSSLDKAREHHRHHGLDLSITQTISTEVDLSVSAEAMVARPLRHSSGQAFGTFELWHRSCRETPIVGKIVSSHASGSSTTSYGIVFNASDVRLKPIPEQGLSLAHCLRSLPGLRKLEALGLSPRTARAAVSVGVRENVERDEVTVIVHPSEQSLVKSVLDQFHFDPNAVDRIKYVDLPNGGIVRWDNSTAFGRIAASLPHASMLTGDEVLFWPGAEPVNEIGYFYLALYVAGNYARYFPDRWLADVESCSPLALAIEHLIESAKERIPLLFLSELSRQYHIPAP